MDRDVRDRCIQATDLAAFSLGEVAHLTER